MTCKDCIHYEACNAMGSTVDFAVDDGVCKEFEDKSLYIKLPCKVGDTAWFVSQVFNGAETVQVVAHRKIDAIGGNLLNPIWVASKEPYEMRFHPSKFGKTVFLTREEAEAALKELET